MCCGLTPVLEGDVSLKKKSPPQEVVELLSFAADHHSVKGFCSFCSPNLLFSNIE